MGFNFFKGRKQSSSDDEKIGMLKDMFTAEQKKAVMCSLLLIANADGSIHRNEAYLFELSAKILGYNLGPNYLDEFIGIGQNRLIAILKGLNESQMDWFLVTLLGMLHADGQVLRSENQYFSDFLHEVGITQDRLNTAYNKSEKLREMYGF